VSRKAIVIAGVVVILAAIAVVATQLGDDSSDHPNVDPSIAEHQNYHQVQYDAGIVNAWAPAESDRQVGAYLESTWHYPLDRTVAFTIDSRKADETGSSVAAANLAQLQFHKLYDYRERSLEPITLRGIPAVRWSFALGKTIFVEYFFEECDIDFIVRGTAPSDTWSELAPFFRQMAMGITAKCSG
jgi:hypothetical protein